jgi:hypothetical protein
MWLPVLRWQINCQAFIRIRLTTLLLLLLLIFLLICSQ